MGHSFVRRAEVHLLANNSSNLNLTPDKHQISFIHRSGCHARHLLEFLPSIHAIKPAMVILDIGTNDLADPDFCPQLLLYTVRIVATKLVREYQVKKVVLMQVMHRSSKGRFGMPAGFARKVDPYNRLIIEAVTKQQADPKPLPLVF